MSNVITIIPGYFSIDFFLSAQEEIPSDAIPSGKAASGEDLFLRTWGVNYDGEDGHYWFRRGKAVYYTRDFCVRESR